MRITKWDKISILISILFLVFLLNAIFSVPNVSGKAIDPQVYNSVPTVLEDSQIANWWAYAKISKLAFCESNWNPKASGDSGKAYSVLQFHQRTFYSYGKQYKLLPQDLEYAETLNRIEEPETQVQIAKKMIEEDIRNLNHWKNCRKKMKL